VKQYLSSALLATSLVVFGYADRCSASMITSNISMDNEFIVYLSTDDGSAGTSFGSGNAWQTTFTDTASLAAGQDYFLHVLARNYSGPSGFLGEFSITGSGHVFANNTTSLLTNTTDWGASTSGWGSYSTPTAWGSNGVAPWGSRPNIDSSATWIWAGPNNVNQGVAYFTARISAVPEPASCSLLALGFACLGTLRFRRH
jgi:hypothetical protein